MGLFKEDERERRLVSRLVTDTTCEEIMEAAIREGFAEIDCFGVIKSLRDHLCQFRERCQQQGDHRFDDLIIEVEHPRLLIYPKQTGAWHPKGGAQFFMTRERIVRCRG